MNLIKKLLACLIIGLELVPGILLIAFALALVSFILYFGTKIFVSIFFDYSSSTCYYITIILFIIEMIIAFLAAWTNSADSNNTNTNT